VKLKVGNPHEQEREVSNTNEINDCGCNSGLGVNLPHLFESESGDPVTCGNGKKGHGQPEVEKQVNNPAEDVASFPRITQSETSLARFKDFILYGFNDSEDPSFSGFAFSSDLGKTWTNCDSIPLNPNGANNGDPTLAVDRNGVFYYGQIGFEVVGGVRQSVISVSTGTVNPNRTITMNSPQVVGVAPIVIPNVFSQDKPWIAVGPDKNTPGAEALYAAWVDFTNPGSGTKIRFSKHRTGVNLVQLIPSKTIVSGTNEVFGPFTVVDKQGNVYVFYESRLPGTFTNINTPTRSIRMAKSTDGGNTFPIDVQVSAGLFEAAANATVECAPGNIRPVIRVTNQKVIRMFEIPQAAIAPDGTIYVVWNAGRTVGGVKNIDVFVAFSKDGGLTWQQVNITKKEKSFAFFPSVAANKKGAHIQYNRFHDPNKVGGIGDGTFAVFMKTFSRLKKISKEKMISTTFSPVPNNHILVNGQFVNFDPGVVTCYMAEYNQVINGPRKSLLHAWGDNRNVLNGENNPDVFFKQTKKPKPHKK